MQDDFVLPFELDRSGLRGRAAKLGPALDVILKRHAYPGTISRVLGDALTLSAILASTLKFDNGVFTLQVRGNSGPIKTLVADITSEGEVRGYVGFDPDAAGGLADDATALQLFGGGYIAFTVDQGADFDRYQGIVELQDDSLASSVMHYFRQSEQIATTLKIHTDLNSNGHWRSSAILVQKLPDDVMAKRPPEVTAELVEADEHFLNAAVLLESATETEMLSDEITAEEMLFRLFHEDGVRVYDKRRIESGCRCKLDSVENVLRQFGRDQVEDFKVGGVVRVTCEFCTKERVFDDDALNALYSG